MKNIFKDPNFLSGAAAITGLAGGVMTFVPGFNLAGVGLTAASGGLNLAAKDRYAEKNRNSLNKQMQIVRRTRDNQINNARISQASSNNAAFRAYRAKEFDVGRKIQARSESNTADKINNITSSSIDSLNSLRNSKRSISGITIKDLGNVALDVGLSYAGGKITHFNKLAKATTDANKLAEVNRNLEEMKQLRNGFLILKGTNQQAPDNYGF